MGDIYAAAERVLVCLSTDSSPCGGVVWLRQLSAHDNKQTGYAVDGIYLETCRSGEQLHQTWAVFIDTIFTSPWF